MSNPTTADETPEQWAVLELMGHIKYGGRIILNSELPSLIRIEVPRPDGTSITQFVNPSSIYRITMTDKALATAAAVSGNPMPFQQWELRDLIQGPIIDNQPRLNFDEDDEEDDDDGVPL